MKTSTATLLAAFKAHRTAIFAQLPRHNTTQSIRAYADMRNQTAMIRRRMRATQSTDRAIKSTQFQPDEP